MYHFDTTQEVIVKKLFALVAIVLGVLVAAGTAYAGCIATVGLGSTPKPDLAPGQTWFVIRILQHGRTPMSDARPKIRIRRTTTAPDLKATPAEGRHVPRAGGLPASRSLRAQRLRRVSVKVRVHTFGSVDSRSVVSSTAPTGVALRSAREREADKRGAIADAEALSGSDEAQAHVRRWWRFVPVP